LERLKEMQCTFDACLSYRRCEGKKERKKHKKEHRKKEERRKAKSIDYYE